MNTAPTRRILGVEMASLAALGLMFASDMNEAAAGRGIIPVGPAIRADFGLSNTQFGLLLSLYQVGAAVSLLRFGWVNDALGVRATLTLSAAIFGAGALLISLAPSAIVVGCILALAGFAVGGMNPSSMKIVLLWFPRRLRGTVMGIRQSGSAFGGTVAAVAIPAIAAAAGWRWGLATAGTIGLVLSAVIWRTYPSRPVESQIVVARRDWRWLGPILHDRQLLALAAAVTLLALAQLTFQAFLLLYLVDRVHLGLVLGGTLLGTANATGACARIAWGGVSDRLLHGARRPVAIAASALAFIGLALLPLMSDQIPLPAMFGIVGVAGAGAIGWTGPLNTMRAEQAGPRRVTAYSALVSGLANFAPVVGAPLFGFAVDSLNSYTVGWLMLAACALAATVLVRTVRDAEVPE